MLILAQYDHEQDHVCRRGECESTCESCAGAVCLDTDESRIREGFTYCGQECEDKAWAVAS